MDLVICVALKDCYFLKKNIAFIEKNINPDRIFIVTDSRNFKYIPKKEEKIFSIDENDLLPELSFKRVKLLIDKYIGIPNYGWYYQQLLKLGFARSKFAGEEYLSWDSDTIPLNPLTFKNQSHVLILPKKEHHQPYFDAIDKLIECERKANYSFIAEHFLFSTHIVNEMLNEIERRVNCDWVESIFRCVNYNCGQGFSEFETYGTYCLNRYPDMFQIRNLNTFRFGSKIFGVVATMEEIQSLSFDLDTVSFEMSDFPVALWRRIIQKCMLMYYKVVSKLRIKLKNFPL